MNTREAVMVGLRQACRPVCCTGQNFVPFARQQTTAHLLLRRFAFFQKVLFAPGCRVMQAAMAPPVVDSRPDAAAALTQPKICLFNMLSQLLRISITHNHELLPLSQPWNSCGGEELCTDLMIHTGTAEWAEHSTGQIFSP